MGRRKPSADCRFAEWATLLFDERADTNVAKRVRAAGGIGIHADGAAGHEGV